MAVSPRDPGLPGGEGRRTILVVDDEEGIRELLEIVFEGHGYQTSLAADGVEALQSVEHNPPDLITLDLAMPVMDGHRVLDQLARNPRTAAIPVVVVSACSSDLTPTAQVVRVIPKPFEVSDLVDLVNGILCR